MSIVINKKVKQNFLQKGFCAMLVSSIVQTSNFSSAIPKQGYNIDSLALPQSENIDKTVEAADEATKQAARELCRPRD